MEKLHFSQLLRNSEFRRHILVQAAVLLLSALTCLFFSPIAAGILLLAGMILLALECRFTELRYRKLAELSSRLDSILHGQQSLLIAECREGELSILTDSLQKMLTTLQEQSSLLQSEKQQLSDSIADIFHQLRTPLTSMNLMVSLLAREDLPYERRVALTHSLRQQLERTRWLVESLLKLSRLDAGTVVFHPETLPLREVLNRAVEPLRIPMELRGQRLVLPEGEIFLTADPDWTAEALGNLLKNAMEHTPEGGSVTVTGEDTALFVQLTVTDTGTGFDPQDIPNLFRRFYRGKNAAPDSIGIGLALCRTILAAQNATITAQNAPEGGAQFVVKFYKSVV